MVSSPPLRLTPLSSVFSRLPWFFSTGSWFSGGHLPSAHAFALLIPRDVWFVGRAYVRRGPPVHAPSRALCFWIFVGVPLLLSFPFSFAFAFLERTSEREVTGSSVGLHCVYYSFFCPGLDR